jgi:hypothetical protein
MFAANAYRIRFATVADAPTLGRLAERYYQQRLVGRILIGEIDGTPAAALSLHDGRVIADSSPHTDRLVVTLRMRAGAIRAVEATPSLRERLLAALPADRGGSTVVPMPASRNGHAEREPVRVYSEDRQAATG